MYGYNDFINNRLRLESVTPVALMHVFGKLMGFMSCYDLPHFTLQSASFYAMKWYELRGNLLDFILHCFINRVLLSNQLSNNLRHCEVKLLGSLLMEP